MSPEVEEFVRTMHYGDPALGWEGDPRLALYRDGESWVVQRYESDGRYTIVARSRPGIALDKGFFLHLMAHDHRRGFNPEEAVQEWQPSEGSLQRTREGLERVYHAAAKDLGYV